MDPDTRSAQPRPDTAGAGAANLTIGELGERTGLSPAVLRMWETRHGLPKPHRLASGHRRYTEADVALVAQVLQRKEAGLHLEAAIAAVIAASAPAPASIFAELRRRHPGLAVQRLRKPTLVALSRAVEDECCAAADRPVLFGAFQREEFYAASAARWADLARTARTAIVFAHDWGAAGAGAPVRAALPDDAPLRREWAVVCDAPDATACVSAWELPGQAGVPDRERIFEAVWTVDPVAVRDAARVAAGVAAGVSTPGAAALVAELADRPVAAGPPLATTTALFNRVVAYADRLSRR